MNGGAGDGRADRLKQRVAESAAHGSSAEGGWAQLSVLVLGSRGPPPAQARSAESEQQFTAPYGVSAEGRRGVASPSRVLPGDAEFSTTG